MTFGAIPTDGRRHQDRATQYGGDVEQDLVRIDPLLLGGPVQQGIQNHLPHNESAVASLDVDLMRIPFPKQIVGPFVGGVNVVVSPQIDRQFVHHAQVEVRVLQHFGRHLAQQFQGAFHNIVIRTVGDTGSL